MVLRTRVHAVEGDFPDALYLVGRAISEGGAIESALARAATSVPGETGDLLDETIGIQCHLRVGAVKSFHDKYGIFKSTSDPRVAGVTTFLSLVASKSRSADRAIISMTDQPSVLTQLDTKVHRELASVAEALSNMAAVFGPLVTGATAALADGMAPAKTFD